MLLATAQAWLLDSKTIITWLTRSRGHLYRRLNSIVSELVEILTRVNLYKNQLQWELKADSKDIGLNSEKLAFDRETVRRGPKPCVSRSNCVSWEYIFSVSKFSLINLWWSSSTQNKIIKIILVKHLILYRLVSSIRLVVSILMNLNNYVAPQDEVELCRP